MDGTEKYGGYVPGFLEMAAAKPGRLYRMRKRQYQIRQIKNIEAEALFWLSKSSENWAEIDYAPWAEHKIPEARAKVVFHQELGFGVYMECREANPRRIHTEQNSKVYEDSCMEFFVNFMPEVSKAYLNFEVNANGVMLCQFGENKQRRSFITGMDLMLPEVKANRYNNYWSVEYWISLSLIQALYPSFKPEDKVIFSGNFYKCADKAKVPHYGVWAPMFNAVPEFHIPEQFGILELNIT